MLHIVANPAERPLLLLSVYVHTCRVLDGDLAEGPLICVCGLRAERVGDLAEGPLVCVIVRVIDLAEGPLVCVNGLRAERVVDLAEGPLDGVEIRVAVLQEGPLVHVLKVGWLLRKEQVGVYRGTEIPTFEYCFLIMAFAFIPIALC